MTTTSTVATGPGSVTGPPPQPSGPDRRATPAAGPRRVARTGGALVGAAYTAVRRESLLVVVLVGSFLSRWLIADRNSYWNDELLSVDVYGQWHTSAGDAIRHLAESSVHPPVYQFVLYHWIDWFGDSERATRSLSNLYITLATLCLFLLLRQVFSRRVALASAIVFALMNVPMYYALEARSYAQTIFLVTLSSYALLRIMRLGADRGWRSALFSPTTVLFTIANAALLLTHYYNVFFWVAQGLIAGLFVLRERRVRGWPVGLGVVTALYTLQGTIFAATWGRVLIDDYRRRGGAFPAEDGVRSPLELLRAVVTPNLDPPRVVALAVLVVAALVVVRTAIGLIRGRGLTPGRQRAWTVAYLVGWLVVPLLVVYLAFMVTGVARYSTRYWLFIVPPLAPLLVLSVREGVRLADRAWLAVRWGRPQPAWSRLAAVVLLGALILPGTLGAATQTKHDWRGTAQQVVDLVQADPDADYLIVETSRRRQPMANHYFTRLHPEIAVSETLQRYEERNGRYRLLTNETALTSHDYLVLIFTHQRTRNFPEALALLEGRFEVRHRQLNRAGRGFIVFDLHPSPEPTSRSSAARASTARSSAARSSTARASAAWSS